MPYAIRLKLGRRWIYAVCIGYKQSHQAIVILKGDIGPFKYDDRVIINMLTLEVSYERTQEYEYEEAA